jgi:hypothetical protein
MDHEQRDAASKVQDGELTARVVRKITEIERDYHFASGPLSDRLMDDVVRIITKGATEPLMVVETDAATLLTTKAWKATGIGNGDAWLELAEISEDESDHCWIAAAVRAGRTQMCLELMFRRGLVDAAQAVIRNEKNVSALIKLGFVRDDAGLRLFIPMHVQAEALAIGFEQNDLDAALAPVGRAVTVATAALAELNKLLEQVRTDSRRK